MNASSHRSGSRLANNPQNLETCDSCCVPSRFLLRCVEIRRDRHHGFFDLLATKSLLRGLAHCIKHIARDLLNCEGLFVRDSDLTAAIRSLFHIKLPAFHVSLLHGRGKRLTDQSFRVIYHGSAVSRAFADDDAAFAGEAHPRWRGVLSKSISYDLNLLRVCNVDSHA